MPDENPEPEQKRPFLGLSLTQLVGGSAAAATAAILGARLGTTGTIIGAALVSVVSAVASAIYTASIKRTREVAARAKEMLPTTTTWRTSRQDLPEIAEQVAEEGAEESTPSLWSRVSWKPVALGTGTFFVIAALLITGFELATGKSIEGGGRTTVNNAFHGGSHSSPTPSPTPKPSKKPTTKPTSTSSESPTSEPTETATAPTPTSSASSTPTSTPTTTPTPTPSATVSPPKPTASPTR